MKAKRKRHDAEFNSLVALEALKCHWSLQNAPLPGLNGQVERVRFARSG